MKQTSLVQEGKTLTNWQTDKHKADTYFPIIQQCIKKFAGKLISIEVADYEKDTKQATDYVLIVSSGAIGCRIRNGRWVFNKYHEFTVRASRPSGAITELEKIRTGYPRWYFYGWADGSLMPYWIFVDVDIFRSSGQIDNPTTKDVKNFDCSSSFIGYDIVDMYRHKCIIEMSDDVKKHINDRTQDNQYINYTSTNENTVYGYQVTF